jgi:hypothetical protein
MRPTRSTPPEPAGRYFGFDEHAARGRQFLATYAAQRPESPPPTSKLSDADLRRTYETARQGADELRAQAAVAVADDRSVLEQLAEVYRQLACRCDLERVLRHPEDELPEMTTEQLAKFKAATERTDAGAPWRQHVAQEYDRRSEAEVHRHSARTHSQVTRRPAAPRMRSRERRSCRSRAATSSSQSSDPGSPEPPRGRLKLRVATPRRRWSQ